MAQLDVAMNAALVGIAIPEDFIGRESMWRKYHDSADNTESTAMTKFEAMLAARRPLKSLT